MGRLVIPNRKYLYIASGIGLSPNINGLRFYDSGLIYNGQKSFYSEDGQYAIWYATFPIGIWLIGSIANIGTFTSNAWGKIGALDTLAGSYIGAGDKVGTVTISEYKNNISIKKQNLGGGKIQLYKKFAPNTLQGLSLWLKADAGVTLAGSNVTSWADQSGNGRNATPNDPTNKPLFNASDKNGKPTISLTSMSDYFERVFSISSNPLGASGSTAFSVQYVEDVCDAGDDNGPIFGNFGATIDDGEPYSQTHYPYGPDCSVYDSFATTSRKNSITPPATITDTWSLYSVYSTNGDWKSFVNGYLMHSDSGNTYNNSIGGDDTTLYIGKQTAGGTYALKGKVAEVILYNRVLTTPERQQVEAYLNDKYNIY